MWANNERALYFEEYDLVDAVAGRNIDLYTHFEAFSNPHERVVCTYAQGRELAKNIPLGET